MVSLKTLFLASTALLSTAISALPASSVQVVRDTDATKYACPSPDAGIKKPANGTHIRYTQAELNNYDGHTIEIIYCSGQYFKTSSLNTTTWFSSTESGPAASAGSASSYYAQALAIGTPPTSNAAPGGYYGYKYNVTIYPIDGDYPTGIHALTVYELQTGYYNANNIETHTVYLNFTKPSK